MFILEGSTLLERRCSHHFSCMCADTCFRVSSQYCRSVLYRIDIYNMIDHPSQGMLHKLVSCFPLFFSKWLHALCGCRPSLTIIEEKHSSKLFSWSKPPRTRIIAYYLHLNSTSHTTISFSSSDSAYTTISCYHAVNQKGTLHPYSYFIGSIYFERMIPYPAHYETKCRCRESFCFLTTLIEELFPVQLYALTDLIAISPLRSLFYLLVVMTTIYLEACVTCWQWFCSVTPLSSSVTALDTWHLTAVKRYVSVLFFRRFYNMLRKDDTIPSSLRDKMSM